MGMELSEKEKSAFLREFGQKVEALIYAKYKSKDQFIADHGFNKRSLHDVLTGIQELLVESEDDVSAEQVADDVD